MRERSASPVVSRRGVLALGIGALVVAAVPFAARGRRRVVRRRIPVMGTIAEVAVVVERPDDAARAHAAIDGAFDVLRDVETRMTCFTDGSDVGRANLGAARDGVAVSAATALVVEEALRWAESSDGEFDPALGAAGRVWDVQHRHVPPPESEFRRFARRGLWHAVDVSTQCGAPALRFSDPDVRLDLGGIAKGYAVDRAADLLRARGCSDGLVNVGGDLVALGRSSTGDPWRVGIQSPDDPDAVLASLDATDSAIATSGDYVRFFEHRGRRYHHLLDPATAAPRATPVHSLTIEAPTCLAADAAATALYGADAALAPRVLSARAPGARIVHVA